MNRRQFLQSSSNAAFAALAASSFAQETTRKKRILLRSSWQTVNIGDIAHTPGVLALLERALPDAEITLWAGGEYSDELFRMDSVRFPMLKKVVKGSVSEDGTRCSSPELAKALEECGFLLHGSGASFVAYRDIRNAVTRTGKPYGIFGITWNAPDDAAQIAFLSTAKFVFFRDGVSLEAASTAGVKAPIMEFGPDGAFACGVRNESAAETFLKEHHLETGRFVCVIPRYRITPYWKIRNKPRTEKDLQNWNLSQQMKEHDHVPLRQTIQEIVQKTDLQVLICPEDRSQVELGREMLYEPLPEDVKKRVVRRDRYWLTDEAVSTYVRSAGLFGLEMHSPILCVGNGVPAIVCRFHQQTSKGLMWRDIGLGDWLFNMDEETEIPRLAPTVLEMLTHPDESLEKVRKAQIFVHEHQARMCAVLTQCVANF